MFLLRVRIACTEPPPRARRRSVHSGYGLLFALRAALPVLAVRAALFRCAFIAACFGVFRGCRKRQSDQRCGHHGFQHGFHVCFVVACCVRFPAPDGGGLAPRRGFARWAKVFWSAVEKTPERALDCAASLTRASDVRSASAERANAGSVAKPIQRTWASPVAGRFPGPH